jgi:hypothetical protein
MGISGSTGAGGGTRSRIGGGGGPREAVEEAVEATGFIAGAGPEPPGSGRAAGRDRVPEGYSDKYDECENSDIDDRPDLRWTTCPEQFPFSDRTNNSSFSLSGWPGPAVRRFARRNMHGVALVLIILLNCLVLQEFDLCAFLFLLRIIHTTAGLAQKSAGQSKVKHTRGQLGY